MDSPGGSLEFGFLVHRYDNGFRHIKTFHGSLQGFCFSLSRLPVFQANAHLNKLNRLQQKGITHNKINLVRARPFGNKQTRNRSVANTVHGTTQGVKHRRFQTLS